MSDLIFIENKKDIDLLKPYFNEDSIVISTHPSVGVELSRRGIDFHNTLDFFGTNGHEQSIRVATDVVEGVRSFLIKLKTDDTHDAFEKTWVFYFRFFLYYWLTNLFIIKSAVDSFSSDRLIAVRSMSISELSMKNVNTNGLLGDVVLRYGDEHNIETICIDNRKKNTKLKPIISFIKHKVYVVIFKAFLLVYPIINHNKVSFLAPDDSYNMPKFLSRVMQGNDNSLSVYLGKTRTKFGLSILDILQGKSFSFIKLSANIPFRMRKKIHVNLDICISNIKFYLNNSLKKNKVCGVNLYKPLSIFIENGMRSGMLNLYGETLSLKSVMNVVRPKCVFSQHSLGVSYALGEYCANHSIPALLISHGSHIPHHKDLSGLEWSIHAQTIINSKYPYVAVQTPWALKFIKEQKDFTSKIIETGPLLFSEGSGVKRNQDTRVIFENHMHKKIILHASSPRGWNTFRPLIYETLDEYIRNLKDIISSVELHPEMHLAIRFRPASGMDLAILKESLPRSDCYSIYTDGIFEDYLLEADLLISYSSTTIEEALQNKIPVLQYDPDGKYMHIPGEEWINIDKKISSIYYSRSKNDLKKFLSWWDKTQENIEKIDWSCHIMNRDEHMKWLCNLIK